jgi:WhiB family transcriptional regulator, redox-sensing transcriptional regulator
VSGRNAPAFATSTIGHTNDWRNEAECLKHDPELWFPIGTGKEALAQTAKAKAICVLQCPVREKCDRWAEDTRQDAGIWGGLAEDERRRQRRARARARSEAAAVRAAEEKPVPRQEAH